MLEYFSVTSVNSLLIMTKKNVIVLAVTFLSVIGFYLYLFKDSFRKADIQISHTIRLNPAYLRRPPASGESPEEMPHMINFGLGREYQLTSVRVVPEAEFETNRFAHAVWEMVSDSNSVPIRAFAYGYKIKGMHPSVKGAKAEPLVPNVSYRLLFEARSMKGHHDFKVTEADNLPQ